LGGGADRSILPPRGANGRATGWSSMDLGIPQVFQGGLSDRVAAPEQVPSLRLAEGVLPGLEEAKGREDGPGLLGLEERRHLRLELPVGAGADRTEVVEDRGEVAGHRLSLPLQERADVVDVQPLTPGGQGPK